MKSVYLAGPINGCSDSEAKDWRADATRLLKAAGCRVLDPMRRDYRGQEMLNAPRLVEGDKRDICECGYVLVFAARPSWGTAMEILYAHERGRRVVAVVPEGVTISPWLSYHTTEIVRTIVDATDAIIRSAEFW